MLSGGEKINVIPGEVSLEIDCRLLPGFPPGTSSPSCARCPASSSSSSSSATTPSSRADLALFETLAGTLRELDPAGRPVPLLLPGVTDGRFFSRLGIQTYGFLPMQLPDELGVHAA